MTEAKTAKKKPTASKVEKAVEKAVEESLDTTGQLTTSEPELETENDTSLYSESVPVDTQDTTETEEDTRDVFYIHSKKCLRCLHLTETGSEYMESCHFSNGNESCPAQAIRIVVGVPVGKVANIIFKAMDEGDAEKLAETYAKLAEKDAVVQQQVKDAVQAKLAEKFSNKK